MVGKYRGICPGKKFFHLRIGYIAVDKRDPIAVPASVDEACRHGTSLPGLANDSEPVFDVLVLWYRSERSNKIFEPLIRPNLPKRQRIAPCSLPISIPLSPGANP